MLTNYNYILRDDNKKDVKFIKLVYDFCNENHFITPESKYVVMGHSVMEIKQALVNATKYNLKFNDGKYRKHITIKENIINTGCNTIGGSSIQCNIPGYLPLAENVDINVITCCDNTWAPFMYKNNIERKNNLQDDDVFLLSGRYLCGNPHNLDSLPKYNIKLSFGFFKDENLAKSVQNQVNYISAGFKYSDIVDFQNILLKPRSLISAYKKNYNRLRKGVCTITKEIKKFNDKYEDYKVKYEVEPSRFYVYITSNEKRNIKKYTTYYNKLNLEYKLYVNSKQHQKKYQTIYTPQVDNGILIKNS